MENKILRTETGYQLGKLHVSGLAPRESQALLLRATGLSINACAQAMNCGKANVQDRIVNLFFKLRVNSTPELITKAFENGFLRFLVLLAAIHLGACEQNDKKFSRVRVSRAPIRQELKVA